MTRLISITANLGDTKTTITHPASTTHGRITPDARAAAGIGEGLLRVAVGLEAVEDLKRDLARGMGAGANGNPKRETVNRMADGDVERLTVSGVAQQ